MTKAYQITNWDENYEIAQSRAYKSLSWVAIPNTARGKGYQAITKHPEAVSLFCAFILMVEVASTMPKRGLLVENSGRPMTAEDLEYTTRFPAEIFELAFVELCKPEIGWIERIEIG